MATQTSSNGSSPNQTYSRSELSAILHESDCWVVFNKKDGSKRTLLASLRPEVIQAYERKTDRVKTVNEDILPVWDIEARAWRSITIGSIISVEIS